MPIKYSAIEIFTNEEERYEGKPLYEAVVQYIRKLKIAARCTVTRAMAGCYENGEIASQNIMVLSFNMPVVIRIVLPSAQTESTLSTLENMVEDGIITVQDVSVRCHKTRACLIPGHLRVKDIMTYRPRAVSLEDSVSDVVRLLLSSVFTGVPVINSFQQPVGVISQGDLIYRAKMPARLGLLADSSEETLDMVLEALSVKKAHEIMSPAVCIKENDPLTKAVDLMLGKELKRLPVTDENGKLAGILSRMDIFCSITNEMPDWSEIEKQDILVGNIKYVSDIMRRDIHTVLPDTPVEDVIRIIDSNDIQRVAVVEKDGRFSGLISDRKLLAVFSEQKEGIWGYFVSRLPFGERCNNNAEFVKHLRSRKAFEVMDVNPVTILENSTIDKAISLMTEKIIKRLPVVDSQGKFKGMISRESLLRAGFSTSL